MQTASGDTPIATVGRPQLQRRAAAAREPARTSGRGVALCGRNPLRQHQVVQAMTTPAIRPRKLPRVHQQRAVTLHEVVDGAVATRALHLLDDLTAALPGPANHGDADLCLRQPHRHGTADARRAADNHGVATRQGHCRVSGSDCRGALARSRRRVVRGESGDCEQCAGKRIEGVDFAAKMHGADTSASSW